MKRSQCIFSCVTGVLLFARISMAAEAVTVDNFARAETDNYMKGFVAQGAFGQFNHVRVPVSIDEQSVVRMNRDTLYSTGVFDLAKPVTIVKPASPGRFMSMLVINEDHSMLPVEHGSGEFVITKEKAGTRYVVVVFRTFVDPDNPDDVKAANAAQDRIRVIQEDAGVFEIPDWDGESLALVRNALKTLAGTCKDISGFFGDRKKLDRLDHLMGTAAGWGGNPPEASVYVTAHTEKNDGRTPYVLTVKDVPVDGFWSVTVYNREGFMEKNDQDAYSYNDVTAKKNEDGGITIHFGAGPDAVNNLPIMDGWNYTVRLYQPRAELLDGTWQFPEAKEMAKE